MERRDIVICNERTPRDVISASAIRACAMDFQYDILRVISRDAKDLKLWSAARRLRRHDHGHKLCAALSFNHCADDWRFLFHAIKRREPAWLDLEAASLTEHQRKVWSADSISNDVNTLPSLRSKMKAQVKPMRPLSCQ